ncbi:2-5A-dependent ribonuclease [Pseudozyma hubeiensis SY62]|uniref:2-5A-dependent ribonuclease n=1 Tax=Pseudozyma hubeiensis (strain SY62) TaxID=1305764 RepID=R9P9M0_PSEHS|nr:2-5A-dependent ribonuclease [Pseudozyma hubeiensis SY62]GAC98088.1 2-5A-dependent ribonuclease [Pseudozyma hubeiensis SY62]
MQQKRACAHMDGTLVEAEEADACSPTTVAVPSVASIAQNLTPFPHREASCSTVSTAPIASVRIDPHDHSDGSDDDMDESIEECEQQVRREADCIRVCAAPLCYPHLDLIDSFLCGC